METGRHEQLEQALRGLGVRQPDQIARIWTECGIGAVEMLAWLAVGIGVDEPHLAAALTAAEWTPAQAAQSVAPGEPLTYLQVIRQHPDSALYAHDLQPAQ